MLRSLRLASLASLFVATSVAACTVTAPGESDPSAPLPSGTVPSPDGGNAEDGGTAAVADGGALDASTKPLAVAVVGDPALVVAPGHRVSLAIRIERGSVTGPVTVRATGLGAAFSAGSATIAEGATTATLAIEASASAAGDVTAAVEASAGNATARASFSVSAARGRIDTRFGTSGLRALSAGVADLAALPDGALLLSMGGAVNSRIREIKKLDALGRDVPTFGTGGTVNVAFPTSPAGQPVELMAGEANLAVLPDGKILYASSLSFVNGEHAPGIGVARLDANGALDTSFGTGGWAKAYFDGQVEMSLTGVAVEPSGAIVLVGIARPDRLTSFPIHRSAALARFTPAGAPDPTFGGGAGKLLTTWGGTHGDARGIDVVDGATYVTGYGDALAQYDRYQGRVAKLAADGTLDASFGIGGAVTVSGGARGVLFSSRGKALVTHVGGSFTGWVGAYDTTTSTLDDTYGYRGALGSTQSYAGEVHAIRVGGNVYVLKCHYGPNRYELLAFDELTGRDAPVFGGSNVAAFPSHPNNVYASRMVRAADGSLVVAGGATNWTGLVGKVFP